MTGDLDFERRPAVPDARRSQLDLVLITGRFEAVELHGVRSAVEGVVEAREMELSKGWVAMMGFGDVVTGDVGLTTSA